VGDRLLVVREVAHRRYLRAAQRGATRAFAGLLGQEPAPERGHRRLPVGQDHWGGRRAEGIRRQQEGPRPKTAPLGGHRGLGAQSKGAQREGARPGRAEAPTAVGTDRTLAPQAPVAGRRIRRQGQEMGQGGDGLSVEIVRKPQKPVPEEVAKVGAEEWAKEGKKVDWQRLMPPRGYVALPRRRVVERTFSWLGQNRRMSLGTTRGCARARKRSSTRP